MLRSDIKLNLVAPTNEHDSNSTMANIEPEEDLTNVSSIDHQWLQFVGLVTKENALDYFANSPFYERTCNNEGNNIY